MFRVPAFYQHVSLTLVRVLEDIGVKERVVNKRRRTFLLAGTLMTISSKLRGEDITFYISGSQVEGTTTEGLKSDVDALNSINEYNVIDDWRDWEYDRNNLMMIQDEHTPPGYCMLQSLKSIVPIPVNEIINEHLSRYRGNLIVLKNSAFDRFYSGEKNGPADTVKQEFVYDIDRICALPCKILPAQVKQWLHRQTLNGKISYEMKQYIEHNKCFVVSVGYKGSQYEMAEWRISTSHAERCLMLNLNITQIQCYVMMKLILKTHLKHPEENSLSTFMCKNVLLLCIEKTDPTEWCSRNLLTMFTFYLIQLRKCVEREYCPHFIINQNNLMAGKFSPHVKHWLLARLQTVIKSNSLVFLRVEIDGFGAKYNWKLLAYNGMAFRRMTPGEIHISGFLTYNNFAAISAIFSMVLHMGISEAHIRLLITIYQQGGELERVACRLLTPFLCSTYGSMVASVSINSCSTLRSEAMIWLIAGFNSDVSSGKLKLASVLYSVGDFITVELVLRLIERQYDEQIVEPICLCYPRQYTLSMGFTHFAVKNDSAALQHIGAFCVRFLRSEIQCAPNELRYEMFRSTAYDLRYRDDRYYWMDWAVVDSLPYLYFMQYKNYDHLQRRHEQQIALNNLISSIMTTRNLRHTETALNLLGQCMEQENRHMDAFTCYKISLNIRPRNNSAIFHMCRLLYQFLRT